jgi:hypothetical protein
VIPVLFMAAGGILAGGAYSVLRRPDRTRSTIVTAVVLLLLAALCVANAVLRF